MTDQELRELALACYGRKDVDQLKRDIPIAVAKLLIDKGVLTKVELVKMIREEG